jgi:hypothetical protein
VHGFGVANDYSLKKRSQTTITSLDLKGPPASSSIVANRLRRAPQENFPGHGNFFRGDRLFPHVGKPFIVVAGEKLGGGFTAQVTIDAGEIVVKFAWNIKRIFVGAICHGPNSDAALALREIHSPVRLMHETHEKLASL